MTHIKKAIKKLSKSPGLTRTVNFRDRMSAMISEYIQEPVIDNPKSKLFKNPLEYWKNNKQHYVILAALARNICLPHHLQLPRSLYLVMLESLIATGEDVCWQKG